MYHELKHYEKRGFASDDKSSNATAPFVVFQRFFIIQQLTKI